MKNIKIKLILISLNLISCNSTAQQEVKRTDECNCLITFNDMITQLEDNYIGLAQMQLSERYKLYEDRKKTYKQKAEGINSTNCTEFLTEFLRFFKDGHLFVFERPNYSKTEIAEFKQKIKGSRLSIDSLNQRLSSIEKLPKQNDFDRILGKWTDGESDFVIIKKEDLYIAYVVNTTVERTEIGELKAKFRVVSNELFATYYSYGYSPRFIRGGVYKEGTLLVASSVKWRKKASSFKREMDAINKSDISFPTISKLDDKNTLLSIPSFNVDYNKFQDFIKDNKKTLQNTINLIIDIRGNRGGNAVYFALIEMYATQNMEGSQGLVLASKGNLKYFEYSAENYSSKVYNPVVERIKNNLGKIVDGPLYPERKFKKTKTKIQNVAILTDNACMSAAESFILHSRSSSDKVKTFGSPTQGVIDYTSVTSLLLESGKQYIYFGYPTSTLHKSIPKNGYNETGIIPDVPIKREVTDKIDFIIKYYSK